MGSHKCSARIFDASGALKNRTIVNRGNCFGSACLYFFFPRQFAAQWTIAFYCVRVVLCRWVWSTQSLRGTNGIQSRTWMSYDWFIVYFSGLCIVILSIWKCWWNLMLAQSNCWNSNFCCGEHDNCVAYICLLTKATSSPPMSDSAAPMIIVHDCLAAFYWIV